MIEISVLDAPVGTGKTTAIFNWMRNNPNRNYLYISPMLTEVEERVPQELDDLEFTYPVLEYDEERGNANKSVSLLRQLRGGRNIAFSHALFTQMDERHMEAISNKKYTLIIDEEVSFVDAYYGMYNKNDIITLENNEWIKVHEEHLGRVEWLRDTIEKDTVYEDLRRMCKMEQLFCAKRSRSMLVTQLPMSLLQSTKENILLTYMFENSVMYSFMKMRGVKISNLGEKYPEIILLQEEEEWKEEIHKLITIGSIPSVKKVQKMKGLSTTWYESNAKKEELRLVGSALRGISEKHGDENILFTMRKENTVRKVNGVNNPKWALTTRTSSDNFLAVGARATNNYSHKTVAVHAYNRFPNIPVQAYLQDYGDGVNGDAFALAEMVQWFWRTAIRNKQPVVFYFLSNRMEKIFTDWLYS